MGSCEHRNETSGSVKPEEFIDYKRDEWLFKKESAHWG